MWKESANINEAHAIAAEKRLNWVVATIAGVQLNLFERHFDGLAYNRSLMTGGLSVYSKELGTLYETEIVNGKHRVVVFHPGPWVDRALAEAQRQQAEHLKKLSVNFTPVDF